MGFPIMIDSGAFSVWTRGETIDLEEYIAFCLELRQRFPEAVFVNLDVIGDGESSCENWEIMREHGVDALPIYHPKTPIKYLLAYLEKVDYIGIGGIAKTRTRERIQILDRLWENHLIDDDRMPTHKVHGMGVTTFSLLKRYPWYSVDSTSWLVHPMYGMLLVPKRRNGAWDYTQSPHMIAVSYRSGERSVRGKHYDNLPPEQQRMVLDFLKERGHRMGFRCVREEDGKGLLLPGVSNSYARIDLSIDFYTKFFDHLVWPRPFNVQHRRRSLWNR